jgi:acyl carrier protein
MEPTAARLGACFSRVFPGLSIDEALAASATALPQWDSLATLNLLALIEEEFGVGIDLDDLDEPPSFQSLLARIQVK